MAPSSRSGPRPSAFSRPRWRDAMFWIAMTLSVVIGALVVVALLVLLGPPRTAGGRIWTAVLAGLGAWIGFVVLSIGLATGRGMERGRAEADAQRGDRFEAHGRRAGRAVGSGLVRITRRGRPADTPTPVDPDSTVPSKPTLDDAARSVGMMVGRRLRDRRDRS